MIITVETREEPGVEIVMEPLFGPNDELMPSYWESRSGSEVTLKFARDKGQKYKISAKDVAIKTGDRSILISFHKQLKKWLREQDKLNRAGIEADYEGEGAYARAPYDPDQTRIYAQPFSVRQAYELIQSGEIDISPDFQRNFVWKSIQQKSRLIESLMLRIPLPAFYFSQGDRGTYQVIDGVQRLTVLRDFMNNRFRLKQLEYMLDCEGKHFKRLDKQYQRRIEQAQLYINVVDASTPTNFKFEIFKRLNQSAKPLKPQEIRNCIARPGVRSLMRSLSRSEAFLNATDHGIRGLRMEDQEFVLRFAAFYMSRNLKEESKQPEYTGNMEQYLDTTLDVLNKCDDSTLEKMEVAFLRAMRNAYHLFGPHAFRKYQDRHFLADGTITRKQLINKSLYTAVAVQLADYDPELIARFYAKESLVRPMASLLTKDSDLLGAISVGTNHAKSIERAIQSVDEFVKANLKHKV